MSKEQIVQPIRMTSLENGDGLKLNMESSKASGPRTGIWVSIAHGVIIVLLFLAVCVMTGLLVWFLKPMNEGQQESDKEGSVPTTNEFVSTTDIIPEETTVEFQPWMDPFLPTSIWPIKYKLFLDPDFYNEGSTYIGKVDITIDIKEATNLLIVHMKKMNITRTEVSSMKASSVLPFTEAFMYKPNEFWVVQMDTMIATGEQVVLTLEFESSLVNGINGFYKSTYVNSETQEESWLATTKFQPTDARKAFPCFDEPKYKAPFSISMRHWSNFTALSNMDVEKVEQEVDPDWSITIFQESYPMSSYLVCFIVTDFKYKEKKLKNGKRHRVWAAPDKLEQVQYALDIGTKIVNWFEDELDMLYHLPKLDQIAIPDFASGAMEHWGLITYRETALLYTADLASSAGQERVALVIAHELAHNYFGNAVTCTWWDDIWLNEGFARFYQYKAVAGSGQHPDWLMDDYFVVRTQQGVMKLDGTSASRPVVMPLTHPDDINQAFDSITYDKGASILRMIENFMGVERFRRAIRLYLKKHENGTVVTEDLWNSFQEVMGDEMDVSTVLDPWYYQMGLPVVDIAAAHDNSTITATPKRFLINPESDVQLPESPYIYKWHTPLSWSTPAKNGLKWINQTSTTFPDPRQPGEWLKFNRQQSGYFRTNYPEDMWTALANQLQNDHKVLVPIERSNLLDDILNIARATQISYATALDMTKYMASEVHYFPWRTADSGFAYISNRLYGEPDYPLWRKYIRDLTENVMSYLQVNGLEKDHLENMLRNYIITLACDAGNKDCLSNVTNIFKNWIESESAIVPPNIRRNVYIYGMMELGDERTWDVMWRRYGKASSAQDKLYILKGLAMAPQQYLLQRYLDYCMDEKKIRRQDFFSAINYASGTAAGTLYLWNWVQEKYEALVERFTVQDRYFGRMVPDIVSGFNTKFQLAQVEAFFARYPDAGAGASSRKKALATIRNNMEWKERNQAAVFAWLSDNVQIDS